MYTNQTGLQRWVRNKNKIFWILHCVAVDWLFFNYVQIPKGVNLFYLEETLMRFYYKNITFENFIFSMFKNQEFHKRDYVKKLVKYTMLDNI